MDVRVRTHGRLTSATEGREHRAFGRYSGARLWMLQALSNLKRGTAIVASLHRERSLSDRWTHHTGVEDLRDTIFQSQAAQSGCCENDGVIAAFVQFPQSRVDIAADVFDLQIVTPGAKLG